MRLQKISLKSFLFLGMQKKVSYPKIEAMWGQSYKNRKVYLENHKLATSEWFDKQIDNSNFDEYNTLVKKSDYT